MEIDINQQKEVELNQRNNLVTAEKQNNFLDTTLGKAVNTALDIGIRVLLPDMIENQVIEIKNSLLKNGFKEGLNTAIDSAVNMGKSAIGIFTGNFENISQVQNAVQKGGIIDNISNLFDFALNKTIQTGVIPKTVGSVLKQGKDVILDNIAKNIEDTLTNQIKAIEKIENYSQNWKDYFRQKDFSNMEKEYKKMQTALKTVLPIEKTIQTAREIENLHTLLKNNGQNFDLSKEQMELVKKL